MAKMVDVRLRVACDEGVTVAMLSQEVIKALCGMPVTEIITEGGEQGMRIHWSTVDVIRAGPLPAPELPRKGAKGRRENAGAEML